jgi:hypothetical protein
MGDGSPASPTLWNSGVVALIPFQVDASGETRRLTPIALGGGMRVEVAPTDWPHPLSIVHR